MFTFSSISRSLEFWSVNYTSMYGDSWVFFKVKKYLGEISKNWPDHLLGTNVYNTLEFCVDNITMD